MKKLALMLVATSVFLFPGLSSVSQEIQLPENYTESFSNYLSLDRTLNPDQIIRLFANDIALQGPQNDGKLAYGSMIIAEVYRAKKDEEGVVITSSLGRRIRDGLALIAVMQREPGFGRNLPENLQNDEWDFAAFTPEGQPAAADLNSCRVCHAPLVDTNHLFSLDHLLRK